MPKKYVKMILHIPIEIYETGDYKIHENRSDMYIEPCDELPPLNTSNRDSVLELLTQMLIPTTNEKIKWNSSSSSSKSSEEEDEDEDDFEVQDEDVEEDFEVPEVQQKEKAPEEEEIKIYKNEIKPKKPKKENNIMTFKKHPHLKDNFTRKIRFHHGNFVPI